MKTRSIIVLVFSLAANSTTLAEDRFLTVTNDNVVRSALLDGSPACLSSLKMLKRPVTETRATDRHKAALIARQCLEQDQARQMAADPGKSVLIYQIHEAYIESANARVAKENGSVVFQGISFGVGVGVSFSDDDIISSAEIDASNLIVATKDETTQPRVILESHYYGWCKTAKCNAGKFGIGPYFGIVAKDDNLISAFSTGVMFGWKDSRDPSSAGFSLGIGAILDADVQSLADGYEEGQPLPPGETSIRFKTESKWGAILFFTRTF